MPRARSTAWPVRFMVDTGATYVGMSAREAMRLGIDFQKGRPVHDADRERPWW
jgi:predicted aspartyl protease